jgi:TonB-linked SusC/RagA family outer membrane protein
MKSGFRFRVPGALGALLTTLLLVVPGLGAQQGGTITGRVLDASTGQPVPAAQVFINALELGGLTQQNGRYLMQNVPAGTHSLTVARIGYRTAEEQITVGGGQTVEQNFALAEEALALDEIIVTGTPGGTQRRAIGNVVTTVDVGNLTQDVAITNFQELLAARSTGLQFTRLSANVGTSSPIKIRGVGSFNLGSNPLIYVDGVRVNNDASAGPNLGLGDGVSVLDDFNPQDIESIEIIKGPAAASLYGTEASAGVIQIITKRGSVGAPQFNMNIRGGQNWMPDPAAKVGDQYYCAASPSPNSSLCQTRDALSRYNMYEESNRYIAEGYFPWGSKETFQNGLAQSYNVDVSGGTDALRYFVSANYEDEEGVVFYNSDETFRLRANLSIVFGGDFSLDVSTGYVDGFTRFANPANYQGGVWTDLTASSGYWLDRVTPFNYDGPGSYADGSPRFGGFYNHLPSDVADIEATRDYSRFTGSATLRHSLGDWLNQRLIIGLDKSWDINQNLYPVENGPVPEAVAALLPDLVWTPAYAETAAGSLIYDTPKEADVTFDYNVTANYDYSDALSFGTSFGAQYFVEERENFSNEGTGFASPFSRTINQLSTYNPSSYSLVTNKALGFYVQEQVSWNDRVFVTGSMRFDDNSTFGSQAPIRQYPNLSGAWVLSEESFWNVDMINSFRVRGAWGKAGRQPSATAGINTFAVIPGPQGTAAIRASSPGNPLIEPEVSTELELGFEMALFDDRATLEFTRYNRTDRKALLSEAVPSSYGIPGSTQKNLGQIDNWGWEARLSMRLIENDAFSFDLDLSADHTMNEIIKLGTTAGSRTRAIGLPYPGHGTDDWVVSAQFHPDGCDVTVCDRVSTWGQRVSAMCDSGVSLAPDAIQARALDTSLNQQDQDAAQFELDQYGVISGGDPVPCGPNQNINLFAGTAFATYVFTVAPRITLLDNALQIFALAEGQYGRTSRDDMTDYGQHRFSNSLASRLEDDPMYVYGTQLGDDWTRQLYDADFWRIREIGARYTLSPAAAGLIGAGSASIAASVRNMFTPWRKQTKIYGGQLADPEYGQPSQTGAGNYWVMPGGANFNLTLRVSF